MQFPFIKLAYIHQTSSKYKDEIHTLLYLCVCVWGCSCECTATQSMRAGFELWVRQAKVTSPRQDGGYGGGLQWSHDAISQCVFVCVCTNVCVCVMSPAQLCQSEKGPPGTAGKAGTLTETQGHRALNAHSAHKDPVSRPSHATVLKILGKCRLKYFIEGYCGRLTQTASHTIAHIHNLLWKEQHLIKAGMNII